MKRKYQVWFVPTRLGAELNWRPELILETDDEEDARMTAALERADEPAPDKDAYMVWHVEEITNRCKESSDDLLS